MKKNCWEYKGCGRGPGGGKSCSAGSTTACDGINSGRNAGRICWSIAGTLSGAPSDCRFAQGQITCLDCDFYQLVAQEEGGAFQHVLLGREAASREELQKKLFEVQRLLHIGYKLLMDVDLDEVLKNIVAEACSVMNAERGTVYIIDEASHSLRSRVIKSAELSEVIVPIDDTSIAGYVANNGTTVNIKDAYEDLSAVSHKIRFNRAFDQASGFRTRSVLAVPIRVGGGLTGVIQVLNKRDGAFTPEDEWFLCRFATEAGLALNHARLFDDIRTLKELDKMKSEFVDMFTHELKSPLATIQTTLDILLRPDVKLTEEKRREFIARMRDRTARLGELIKDLMELSKIKRGAALGDVAPRSVRDVLGKVTNGLRTAAEHKRIALDVSLPDADPLVRADEQTLRLIISNLIGNAIKYSPEGRPVGVRLAARPSEVLVSVADRGIGIPEAEQDKLFGEFFRASNAKRSGIEGTGLGLAGVKQLVERFGGDIWFKSKENEGTTFFVRFPRAAPPGD
ncbi:MAG: GAF domain-containing sensor histidine kinase [Planctomycetota bacterium]